MDTIRGHFDGIIDDYIIGWAQDVEAPEGAVIVDFFFDDAHVGSAKADIFRPDLLAAGIGTGRYGFQVGLSSLPNLSAIGHVSVRLAKKQYELSNSPIQINPAAHTGSRLDTLKIDSHDIDGFLKSVGQLKVRHFLVDPIDTCNADCVYCPHPRTKARLSIEQFKQALQRLESVRFFQFGCGQEPTAHPELPAFLDALKQSHLKPNRVSMVTNGTLLGRHPWQVYADRLTDLQFSLDTVDPAVNNITRRNADFNRITKNLEAFHANLPAIRITFSTVVNALTVDGVEELLNYGERVGVAAYHLREIYDELAPTQPPRNHDFHEWMAKLRLKPGQFDALIARLTTHAAFAKVGYSSAPRLTDDLRAMRKAESPLRLNPYSPM